jgi:hypothetical protein
MKTVPLNDLKKEMKLLDADELFQLCLHMARFKKENKELLTYLLFESSHEAGYVQSIREELNQQFAEIKLATGMYIVKKNLRKILRYLDRFLKYTDSKASEIELRMHYCAQVKESGIRITHSKTLENLVAGQLKKVRKAISGLDEDSQFDFTRELESLLEDWRID